MDDATPMPSYPELAAIRLGYGLSPRMSLPANADDLLASVAAAGPDDDSVTQDIARRLHRRFAEELQKDKADASGARVMRNRVRHKALRLSRRSQQVRLARAVGDAGGFGERLVQFWADHFTVQTGGAFDELMAAAFVEDAIRPHLGGRFADMMFAAETHPRMLRYLNQARSFGPNSRAAGRRADADLGLNENLAREMIELHSLGVGAEYTQADVRQLAMLLTGLTYATNSDESFRPGMAEPGAETVLGVSYGGDGEASLDDIRAVIDDLALNPATADHLARKLVVHFVADDPPQALVERLAARYRDSGGDLPLLYRELAEAPELATHFRQKLRQPLDFIVAAMRGLGFERADVMALEERMVQARLIRPLTAMGQKWGMPRGPDGWPEHASAWATPQGLAARIDWAVRQVPQLVGELPDPRDFLRDSLGDTASEPLTWAVPKAESVREGLAVVLGSADFNRR